MRQQCALRGAIGGLMVAGALWGQSAAKVDFRRDVMPLFKAYCIECHGSSVQMNGFRLDRRRDAMKGGTIPVIGPGNSAASRFYLKLIGSQYGPQMPPTGQLKAEQIEIIKNWIDQGAEWPDDVSGEAKLPPADPKAARLMDAMRKGDAQEVRKLVAADPASVKAQGPGGSTPLMYAVLYADAATMRLLMDKGADVNTRNHGGATALMWAADNVEKTKLLLERGANVNTKSEDGRTALMIASGLFGKSDVVKLLLDKGADVAVTGPALFREATALGEAAIAGDETTMRLLIEHGADPKSAGPAPVALAGRAQCGACMAMLLKQPTPDVVIPAMFFASPPLGPGLGVPPLLASGGNANAKDPQGNGLLALVAASPLYPVEAIKTLLDAGADKNATTFTGETALDIAKRHGRTPVVDLLMKAGAKESGTVKPAAFQAKPAADIRAAVQRSLPLLQKNDATFLRKAGCVSCHNNTLASETVAAARRQGFRVDEQQVEQQRKTIGTYLETWRDRALQNIGIPGDTDTVGYILLGLGAAKYPADAGTDAMARFVKGQQRPDGHWFLLGTRPPIEASLIEVTAVAMRVLQLYAPKPNRAEYDQAIKLAASWIARAAPQSTEDRAFQLRGLAWSGADKETIRKAAAGLLAEQRSDGGWSQISTLESDAYATGQALVALQESGAVAAGDAAAKRGLEWLRKNQAEDGSWFVARRTVPIQPHFESGFPYGKDQFISAAATNWAATALAMAAK